MNVIYSKRLASLLVDAADTVHFVCRWEASRPSVCNSLKERNLTMGESSTHICKSNWAAAIVAPELGNYIREWERAPLDRVGISIGAGGTAELTVEHHEKGGLARATLTSLFLSRNRWLLNPQARGLCWGWLGGWGPGLGRTWAAATGCSNWSGRGWTKTGCSGCKVWISCNLVD